MSVLHPAERPAGSAARSAGRPVVRPATVEDGPALTAIDERIWSTLHSVQAAPRGTEGAFFDERHPPADCLVAELPGREGEAVVGYVWLAETIGLPSHAHVRTVNGLGVDESARGAGVARALLQAACDRARAQGALRLTLRVLGHNAPARRLYESLGFVVEGVLPGEFLLDGQYVDDVLMGRRLD
jgi:ribosomal protein S18 acetylase RimI-like enzyme